MTTLADRKVRVFVEALASRAPAPGGGSAAALTSALGAALLGMVGRIVLARPGALASRRRVRQACVVCDRERRALLRLMDEDARAYTQLIKVWRRGPSPARRAAQRRAIEAPLTICERTMAVLRQASCIQSVAGHRLVSDVAAGAALLTGGFAAAAATVAANLDGLDQPAQAEAIRRKLRTLTRR